MMSQTNLGNAMTIINNTARSLAQSETKPNKQLYKQQISSVLFMMVMCWHAIGRLVLNAMKPNKQFRKHQISSILLMMAVCWHAIGRLVLNAMKPNKQFRKHQVQSILLVVVMCWASQSSAQPTRARRALGECIPLEANNDILHPIAGYASRTSIYPIFSAESYFSQFESRTKLTHAKPVIKLLQKPIHGQFLLNNNTEQSIPTVTEYIYEPIRDFVGVDKAVFEVKLGGKVVKVNYYIHVVDFPMDSHAYDPYNVACASHEGVSKGRGQWKISATTPDGTPIFSNEDTAVSSVGTYTPNAIPITRQLQQHGLPQPHLQLHRPARHCPRRNEKHSNHR